MKEEVFKIKTLIEGIILEHNKIWGDISINHPKYFVPKGYNCFTLKEQDILTIAEGLVKKGVSYK
jgi:hypothetical protein